MDEGDESRPLRPGLTTALLAKASPRRSQVAYASRRSSRPANGCGTLRAVKTRSSRHGKNGTPTPRRRVLLAMDLNISPERQAGVVDYAREHGWIIDSRLFAFLVRGQHKAYLAGSNVAGILSLVHGSNRELLALVKAANVPVVDMWHDVPGWKVPRVLLDHEAIGRMGAEHLLSLGFRDLLFYSHTVDSRIAEGRRDAFRQSAGERGARCSDLWWSTDTPMPRGVGRIGWLGRQLKAFARPLGVMAVNDVVASEVIEAAEQAGLRVPEDVAVLGADNNPILTELGSVPISSVDVGKRRVGYEAAALLDRLMSGQRVGPEWIRVPPVDVVVRRSTEVLAVGDADVGQAARFIRDHFREPITVGDVADAALLSRRRLQDRFRAAIGHGMSEEITRQRVVFGKHLLTNTSHKISSVARLAGFGSVQRMSKVFGREVGIAPRDYRLRHQPRPIQ